MSGKVTVSAPGKLVLTGEYAVLDGAPGVAVAVEPLASASIVAADAGRLVVPGTGVDCGFEVGTDGTVLWRGDHRDKGTLIEAAAAVFAAETRSGSEVLNSAEILLDTRDFHAPDGTKLGLGSSAAITVALTASMLASLGEDHSSGRVEEVAGRIHRRLQGGAGSGIDVSTSAHGGLGAFTAGSWQPVAWPPVAWRAIWTGESASTRDLVLRYPNVSKLHATFLVPREGGVKTPNDVETLSIFDHGSANGTKLDGAVVEKETAKVLCSGSRLDFGGVELRLLDVEAFHALLLERAKAPAAS